VTEMMRSLKDIMPSSDDLLHTLGLQYERNAVSSAVSTVTAFAIGAIAGAVVATFFAPKTGAEMRQDLNERVRAFGDRMGFSERPDEDEQLSQH
jgi:hypothetical protein